MNNPTSQLRQDLPLSINTLLAKESYIDKSTRKKLLCELMNINSGFIISHGDDNVAQAIIQRYFQALHQLEAGRPLAYVLGYQPFWKHDFLVNEHTLIPRPDTEILVQTILDVTKNSLSKNHKILDLGTGTGCIAISLANEMPASQVTAVDFSQNALHIAQQNAQRVGVSNIDFLQGSWFAALPAQSQQFDIIVSNPPYIDPNDEHLAALTHEPISALVAPEQGIADIKHIISHAIYHLYQGGVVAIEHGYDQAKAVRLLFDKYGYQQISTIRDYGGNDRVTVGIFN